MPYFGNPLINAYTHVQKQTITADGSSTYVLDIPVTASTEVEVFVNNVRQEPVEAYWAYSTTLAMSEPIPAGTPFYVVYQGKAVFTAATGHFSQITAVFDHPDGNDLDTVEPNNALPFNALLTYAGTGLADYDGITYTYTTPFSGTYLIHLSVLGEAPSGDPDARMQFGLAINGLADIRLIDGPAASQQHGTYMAYFLRGTTLRFMNHTLGTVTYWRNVDPGYSTYAVISLVGV